MTTEELLAELRGSQTDLGRFIEAMLRDQLPHLVVPAKAVRAWRERDFTRKNPPFKERLALKLWAFAARRPRLYHVLTRVARRLLARRAGARGSLRRFPLLNAWTETRDLAAPQGGTFHELYARTRRGKSP